MGTPSHRSHVPEQIQEVSKDQNEGQANNNGSTWERRAKSIRARGTSSSSDHVGNGREKSRNQKEKQGPISLIACGSFSVD